MRLENEIDKDVDSECFTLAVFIQNGIEMRHLQVYTLQQIDWNVPEAEYIFTRETCAMV